MSDPFGLALMLAMECIYKTVQPYIDGPINMTIEAEVHQLINKNLKKLVTSYDFTAETIFDYDTEQLVTTLNGKSKAGTPLDKPIVVRHVKGMMMMDFNQQHC